MTAGFEVAVRHEQRLPHEGETPGRVEERARNSSDLIAGGVQDRDLIRTEQAHIEVARLRERETGRLGRGLRRVEWELVHQLEIRCRRMVDQANSVDQSRERVVERHRDGEVQPLARRIDPPAEWPAREAEEAGQPGIGEPDRGHAIGSDTPDPGLVVGHVEVSRPVEHEVVPHRLHPVATEARAGGHLGEHLGGGGVLAEVEAEDATIHVGDIQVMVRLRVARARPNRPISEFTPVAMLVVPTRLPRLS